MDFMNQIYILCDDACISLRANIGLISNVISTFVGHLMPKLFSQKNSNGTI